MRSCRTASVLASVALLVASTIAACRDAAAPEVPPLTTALTSLGTGRASSPSVRDATTDDASTSALLSAATEPPITAAFVDAPGKIDAPICSRLLIAVAKGKVIAMGETLAPGDVLVLTHPAPINLEGTGLVVVTRRDFDPSLCGVKARPAFDKRIVRAGAAPDLRFAGGGMSAHLDVGPKLSPDVYLGRLEGTAEVAEHTHEGAWEILAAVEANGIFVLDGTEGRLAPRQIIMVPPGAKHAWRPDRGSKLVAIQMYSPPGPEQRFLALAAADKDAGARDSR